MSTCSTLDELCLQPLYDDASRLFALPPGVVYGCLDPFPRMACFHAQIANAVIVTNTIATANPASNVNLVWPKKASHMAVPQARHIVFAVVQT